MRGWLIAALLVGVYGGLAQAQIVSSLAPPATTASVSAAIQAAQPAPCTAPLPDTYGGSAGTGTPCMTRPDATRPTQIQAISIVTASDGTFSGSWPVAFPNAPTGRAATVEVDTSSSAPYICAFFKGQVTATAFAGKCWQIVPTTLPSTATALLGLTISPLANAAAGQTVRVTGRQ